MYDSDKIGFIGVNGVGKSTLFKMIAGAVDYDGGSISKSRDARIGYLEQHPISDGSRTLMEEMLTTFSKVIEIEKQLDHIHDIESVEWLEDFLSNYNGAFIVVSHDRFFLDKSYR